MVAAGWIVGLLLIAVAAGALPAPAFLGAVPLAAALPRSDTASPVSAPVLSLDPASWEMPTGNATSIAATWGDVPPGCALAPQWYRWAIATASPSGFLNRSSGPDVQFESDGASPGASMLRADAAAVLRCGLSQSLVEAVAFSNVTVVASLSIVDLELLPAPLLPSEPAELSGAVLGGTPPYSVWINWTDGSGTRLALAAPGNFSASHAFRAGIYDPAATVTDASGLVARAAVPESVEVSNGTAVAIFPVRTRVDVGDPLAWNATIVGTRTPWLSFSMCDGLIVLPATRGAAATSGNCTFPAPGPATISVEVDGAPPESFPTATAAISVVPDPNVSLELPEAPLEVGVASDLVVAITGGVPPFSLGAAGPALGGPTVIPVLGDGTIAIPLDPDVAGTLPFTLEVTDAAGVESPLWVGTLAVEPALAAAVAFDRTSNASGASLDAIGSVTAGPSPFTWVIVPSEVPANGSAGNGSLAADGSFGWTGFYRTEAAVVVDVIILDAAGAIATANGTLPTVPPLTVAGGFDANTSGPPGSVQLALVLSGGLPPFNISVTASTGASWNFSVDADGPAAWELRVPDAGTISLSAVVRDAIGATGEANGSVLVAMPAAAPAPSPSSPIVPLLGGLLMIGLLAGAALAWRRRRRRAPERPAIDPVAVLRGIIAPADGADRATVELLAEEAGVPLLEARASLDRLVREGTVRSEVDADGTEVLAWELDAHR